MHAPTHIPAFAGDVACLLKVPMWGKTSRLPPFIITAVQNMKNITETETHSLSEEPTICCLIIIKQSSARQTDSSDIEPLSGCFLNTL